MEIIIRKSEEKDLPQLLDIYNYEVVNGVSTLDLEERTPEEWRLWFSAHNVENHPLYTAEADRVCAGYASLSGYRDKEAYKSTVELSVYVSPKYRGMGIASRLMEHIIGKAKEDERTHLIVSVITSGNEASCRLHEKFGFEFCGTIKEVGVKFGKYQNIDNYSLKV